MNIIAGPPGAGKTTQCKLLRDKHGYIWISAGKLLREQAEGKNKEDLLKGVLVDDNFVDSLVKKELDKYENDLSKILLDGFPRDFYEARWLQDEYGADVTSYILIDIPDDIVEARLLKRGRADDTPDSIRERLDIFHEQTEGILDLFVNQAVRVYRVDGSQNIADVNLSIREALEATDE